MKLVIEIHGENQSDLELGLAEVTRSVTAGNLSGTDKNDTGRYAFNIEDPTEDDEEAAAFMDDFARDVLLNQAARDGDLNSYLTLGGDDDHGLN